MKKIAVIAAVVLVLLSGCATSGTSDNPESDGLYGISTGYVKLPDGRTVLCVSNHEGYAGGLSCDWSSAK